MGDLVRTKRSCVTNGVDYKGSADATTSKLVTSVLTFFSQQQPSMEVSKMAEELVKC